MVILCIITVHSIPLLSEINFLLVVGVQLTFGKLMVQGKKDVKKWKKIREKVIFEIFFSKYLETKIS